MLENRFELGGHGVWSCVVECKGCSHMRGDLEYGADCAWYSHPAIKWRKLGGCEGATHVERVSKDIAAKVRVGQQKQKTKKDGGKK